MVSKLCLLAQAALYWLMLLLDPIFLQVPRVKDFLSSSFISLYEPVVYCLCSAIMKAAFKKDLRVGGVFGKLWTILWIML
ncbi:hypothetical protein B0F90DRAFT_1746867 [Multifurca ochricompacta]|uniref:Uncharacterized protein n=1 Tax=Multifurca ochricompacta TaxID=376703 RepID=A0AAD4M1P6_9AGAM|nr:hypothetical protein B0F90DRAFT_1746867 [Multifurca ochricompacta]